MRSNGSVDIRSTPEPSKLISLAASLVRCESSADRRTCANSRNAVEIRDLLINWGKPSMLAIGRWRAST